MTATTVYQPHIKKQSKMSYEEYLEFATESNIVEWVDGEVIIHMPPVTEHQNIIGFLYALLRIFVDYYDLGIVLFAPFEVKLWVDGPSREPDLLFVSQNSSGELTKKRFVGAPELVIEVVSPSSVKIDRVHKFSEYEQAGVREYWIIDPRPYQQQAEFFERNADGDFVPMVLDENGRFHSNILPNFWLDVVWFWQTPLPNPQLILSQIILTTPNLPDEAKTAFQTLVHLLSK